MWEVVVTQTCLVFQLKVKDEQQPRICLISDVLHDHELDLSPESQDLARLLRGGQAAVSGFEERVIYKRLPSEITKFIYILESMKMEKLVKYLLIQVKRVN